ncbi:hypothetical protein MUK42_10261 [Musa troglodytarum]|uniref:Uncharacterized protein n=1 Tax=Musa troglodytarum TaxID=320322 RepID=A0A9E7FMS5_9LILI|nr:hypothetical protein MUK42_10261 [Musa troglodytarum]
MLSAGGGGGGGGCGRPNNPHTKLHGSGDPAEQSKVRFTSAPETTAVIDSSRWNLACFAMNASIVRRNSSASSTPSSSTASVSSSAFFRPTSVSDRRSSDRAFRRRTVLPDRLLRSARVSTHTALSSNTTSSGVGAGLGGGSESEIRRRISRISSYRAPPPPSEAAEAGEGESRPDSARRRRTMALARMKTKRGPRRTAARRWRRSTERWEEDQESRRAAAARPSRQRNSVQILRRRRRLRLAVSLSAVTASMLVIGRPSESLERWNGPRVEERECERVGAREGRSEQLGAYKDVRPALPSHS